VRRRVDLEEGAEFGQKLFRRETLQILQHAVVGQDLHLVVREDHRQEVRAVARATPD
jgi:hypothetical protein